jgi:hypothetical protein
MNFMRKCVDAHKKSKEEASLLSENSEEPSKKSSKRNGTSSVYLTQLMAAEAEYGKLGFSELAE